MKLPRPLALIDLEATGLDPEADYMIELAVLVWDGEEVVTERVRRFKPPIPIPPAATEVHHITDADVENEPPFTAAIGKALLQILAGCDLAGFNLRRLDLPLIDKQLRQVGLRLEMTGVAVVDAFGIFSKKEPRNLEAAVKRYCKREHEGAHGAGADNRATLDVLRAQIAEYEDLAPMTMAELATFSQMGDYAPVDLAGKLGRDKDGDMVFNFGQKRGTKVKDDTGFAFWMIRKDFPASTIEALEAELHRLSHEPEPDDYGTLTGQGGVEDVAETGAPIVTDPRAIGAGWEKG